MIRASPPALHPLGQPSVALTPGRPAFRFTPWPVKCEAYFTGHRQFRMEPRADLEQRSNPPLHLDPPLRLRRHPRKNLEQSRFAGPIPPDDAEHLPSLHLERNILQRVDPVRLRLRRGVFRLFSADFADFRRFGIQAILAPSSAGGIRRANGSEFFGVHLQARLRVAFQNSPESDP